MKLLVTGGAGFIGSHFARSILHGEYPDIDPEVVTVLDCLSWGGDVRNLEAVRDDPRLRFVLGDIRDEQLVGELMREHDTVAHLAAETHVDRSVSGAAPFIDTNVGGTRVLLDAAVTHGVERFLHVSTDEVYGSIDEGAWTEEQPLAPTSPYSAAKAGSDLLALAFHRTHGLPVVVTRCSNNYGPHQFPEKLIPLFVTRLLQGLDVPLYGDGGNIRDWLHVSDHCRGLALALTGGRAGEIYHIGGGRELTNRELVERLLKGCGVSWDQVTAVPDRKGHDRRYALDHSKITQECGYQPQVDFDLGLADTIDWYSSHRSRWPAPR
ncbi:dTDP-glucose 4,6-dehydratase [Jidongwangia harbinensis]|uniref:dTDP-glucose 4,6-dehydratase n=1 Tax=Jidongwangia harbinensis TaxID=2878561 RepID=UPI001CD98B4B|nr:dTDP-glucose 4,6-dehydratase [Jidongwangia harbinensis]MCA2217210.1 dTDP-glucose 4,6-dehydratase [Jidongwangia harbinensis]